MSIVRAHLRKRSHGGKSLVHKHNRRIKKRARANLFTGKENKFLDKWVEEDEKAYRDAEEQEEKYERFLKSRKALFSKDPIVREDARDLRRDESEKEILVKLEGQNKFTSFPKLAEKYDFKGRPEDWNKDVFSWGQKVKEAKLVYKDPWTGAKKDERSLKLQEE